MDYLHTATLILVFLVIVAFAIVYMAPSIVARRRRHRWGVGIFLLNLLLGWTIVGWWFALVLALS